MKIDFFLTVIVSTFIWLFPAWSLISFATEPVSSWKIYSFREDSVTHVGVNIQWFGYNTSLNPLSRFCDFFELSDGKIIEKQGGNGNFKIMVRTSSSSSIMAEFKMGIIREIAENRNNTIDWQITYFDPEGNIRSISCAAHSDDLKLESGSGYYYATEIISEVDTIRYAKGEDISAYTKSVIKEDEMGFLFSDFPHILNDSIILRVRTQAYMSEEGLVENNFKIGQWKYYNDKGETIRTANYHLKDRIDVRFPYYYFNICEDSGCPINLNGR